MAWLRELAFELVTVRATGTIADGALVDRTLMDAGAERLSMEIALACGLITDTGGGSVRFQHHRLQEYFAALRLADLIDEHQANLFAYLDDPWWQEVFVMAAGLSNHPESLIEVIMDESLEVTGSRYTARRRNFNLLILAMRCYQPAQQKLPLYTKQMMMNRLIQIMLHGNPVQRVKALRVAAQFSDTRVAAAVRANLTDPIRWVRENAILAFAALSAGSHDRLTGFGYQMFRMLRGETALLQGLRDFPVFLRHRSSRPFVPLLLVLAVLGILRASWVLLVLYAALGIAVLYGLYPMAWAIALCAFVPGIYLLSRWIARRSNRIRPPRSLNFWALSFIFWGVAFQVFYFLLRLLATVRSQAAAVLVDVIYIAVVTLLWTFALRNLTGLIQISLKVILIWRRGLGWAASPIERGRTPEQRLYQARELIKAAQAETDPTPRARHIEKISSLVPLGDEILVDLEEFISEQTDNEVKSTAWRIYNQIDEALRRGGT